MTHSPLREKCLMTALERHTDDDKALVLAQRLYDFMTDEAPTQTVITAAVTVEQPLAAAKPKRVPRRVGRRFTEKPALDPAAVTGLPSDHVAVVEGRTLFPSTVVDPGVDGKDVLVSGKNNRKLGERIIKGAWAGMPIYHVTLEERSTCPTTCANWSTCYGNSMHMARRHKHGPELIERIGRELDALFLKHDRIAVRLHTLGDFYSVEYVGAWRSWLLQYPGLHLLGFTARSLVDSDIGEAIGELNEQFENRCFIRWSSAEPGPATAVTIFRKPDGPVVPEGIVCPAQTGQTECCGTCGLCWAPAAWDRSIAFVAHGMSGRPRKSRVSGETPVSVGRPNKRGDVWRALAELISETGVSPSGKAIAGRAGCSIGAAQRHVGDLFDDGYLERVGSRRSTKYRVVRWPDGVVPRETAGWPAPPVSDSVRVAARVTDLVSAPVVEEEADPSPLPPEPKPRRVADPKPRHKNVFDNAVFVDTGMPPGLAKAQGDLLSHMVGQNKCGWVDWNIHYLARALKREPNEVSYARSELRKKGYIEASGIPGDSMFRVLLGPDGLTVAA